MIHKIIFLIFFYFLNIQVSAQILTLEEVLLLAVQNSEIVKIVELQALQSKLNNSHFNAGQLPDVQFLVNSTSSISNTNQSFVDGRELIRKGANASSNNAATQVVWNVFDGFGMFHRKNLLESNFIEATERSFQQQLTVKIFTTQTYLSVLATQEQFPILLENIQISKDRFDLITYKKSIGLASEYEVSLANQAYLDDSISYLNLENQFSIQKNQLSRLISIPIENQTLEYPKKLLTIQSINDIQTKYFLKNPFYKEAFQRLESAKFRKKSNQSTQLPSISAFGSFNWNRSASEAGFLAQNLTSQIQVGLQMSYFISQAFDASSFVENSQIDISIEQLSLSRMENDVRSDLTRRVDFLNRQNKIISLSKKNVLLSESVQQIDKSKLELGQISGNEYRILQLDGLRRKRSLVQTEIESLQATIELELLLIQR